MSDSLADLKLVYLIYGTEDLLLQRALGRLRQRVAAVADLDFNSDTFEGESASGDDVVAACNTLPFLSERRLVVVKNVDKMNKDGQEKLAAYAGDPSPTTILVLVAAKMAKNTRLYKAVDKIKGVSEFAAPRKGEYPAEARRILAERGKNISMEAAETLVRLVGADLRRLNAEIDKTVAFVGTRTEVTLADVEAVASTTASTVIYEFPDAVANRDLRTALRLLDSLLSDGESIYGIHALTLLTLRNLLSAHAIMEKGGGSLDEISRALGKPSWMLKNVPRQVRGFEPGALVDALRAAAETEAQMKTSRDPRLAFERWVVRVCG